MEMIDFESILFLEWAVVLANVASRGDRVQNLFLKLKL